MNNPLETCQIIRTFTKAGSYKPVDYVATQEICSFAAGLSDNTIKIHAYNNKNESIEIVLSNDLIIKLASMIENK